MICLAKRCIGSWGLRDNLKNHGQKTVVLSFQKFYNNTKYYQLFSKILKYHYKAPIFSKYLKIISFPSETLKREPRPLQKIADNYPKYLLTMDSIQPNANYDGIQKKNLLDWLLEE